MIYRIKKLLNKVLNILGYKIVKIKKEYKICDLNKINLNIGSGNTTFANFINLDKSSSAYQQTHKYIEYDISREKLNYKDNSVDNIYVSHVIEYFTDKIVQNFFDDTIRKLKFGGTLRLCCPDAKFLFHISSFKNDYWKWRYRWFKEKNISLKEVTQTDFLIQEIATRKLRFFNKNDEKINQQIEDKQDYDFSMKLLTSDQKFDQRFASDHINFFDFKKINDFLHLASEKNKINDFKVVESKPNGSISIDMQSDEFDKEKPQMSLYVDYLKLA